MKQFTPPPQSFDVRATKAALIYDLEALADQALALSQNIEAIIRRPEYLSSLNNCLRELAHNVKNCKIPIM